MSLDSGVDALAARLATEFNTVRGEIVLVERIDFYRQSTLTAATGTMEVPIHGGTFAVQSVAAHIGTAGTALVVDVLKSTAGGAFSSIFATTGDRPTWTTGKDATIGALVSGLSLTTGDVLRVDVISSSGSPANLQLSLRLLKTA